MQKGKSLKEFKSDSKYHTGYSCCIAVNTGGRQKPNRRNMKS